MYVCVCKAVTCKTIRSAVREEGLASLRELSRQLGVATQCGKCATCARRVLDEALGECAAERPCHPAASSVAA